MNEQAKEESGGPAMDCDCTWVMILAYVHSRDFRVERHGSLESVNGAIGEALADAFERNGLSPGNFDVMVERELHTLDSARDLCVEMAVANTWPPGKIRRFLMRQLVRFCKSAARGFRSA